MSIGEKLKETYFAWEEKWYSFLDKVDGHIPIYKVVDRVDDVVPSFALILILIFILFLLLLLGTFGFVTAQQSTLKLIVVDSTGSPVSTAQVSIAGVDQDYFTNDFGLVSDIILPGGRSVVITALKGDRSKTQTIWLDREIVEEQIVLPAAQISFSSRTIQFVNETNALITDELNLEFSCSSGATPPQPQTRKIYNGVVNIEEPSDCGTLLLTITSQQYKTKNVQITQSSRTIRLEESMPTETGKAAVSLKFENELIEESIRVSAYKASNPYIPEETINSVNGVAVFTLATGDYIFETRSEQGYLSKKSEVVNVNTQSDATTTINLEKSVIGKINVIVRRGNIPVEEALVTLRKGTSAIENELTNSDGNVTFELGQTGPFIIVATKEGYCEEAINADLGDTVQINLTRDTGTCGGELKIRVVDNFQKPIQFARALIFGETEEDEYKLNYATKTTNYDGNASWNPVKYSEQGERYRIFAYKGSYSGWSEPFTFSSITQNQTIPITLQLEDGQVNVKVIDRDRQAVQFAEVQLFEDYGNTRVTGKRIIQDTSGLINFNVRAGQRVYAVIEKEGYETYTTMPKEVIGNGNINFEVTLARPPLEEIFVDFVGLYKNDKRVLQAQPGEDYLAIFELTAPKEYDELGFFIRVGEENVTKTEMDKIYIKELVVPGVHTQLKGASFNPPRGYNIDQDYLNLEESKWASATWNKFGYAVGKIRVGAIISIKQTAKMEDLIEIGYRAWGRNMGYERDPVDSILGTTESNSQKQALYAATKRAYAWIGTESLCEVVGDNSFCVSATVTDPDGIRTTFDSSFDAKNNTKYNLGIKVTNASILNFINTSTKLENNEENLFIGSYSLIAPNNSIVNQNANGFFTEWLPLGEYRRDTEFSFNGLEITPRQMGYGTLLLRLRDTSTILFEKLFGINIASDRKMTLEYLYDGEYITTMPQIASGTLQTITLRALNVANGLEINEATVKIYDRFGSKIFETKTNTLGIATIQIPAALPGERLRLQVEKAEYETKIVEFTISEDIVNITPQNLSFTVNPQTKTEDTKTVRIENKTGFDLRIQNIEFSGRTRGLISTSRMESWFAGYVGKNILSNDFEEIDFKVISAPVVPTAGDIEGVFLVTVGNDAYSWVQEVDAKIRVGLGNDVDNANCLEISRSDWVAQTQGEEIEFSFEIRNNCTVESMPVQVVNMGGMLEPSGNVTGKFSAQSTSAYTELSRGFARTFRPIVNPGEVVPVTVKFTPYGGTSGTTSGSITFRALNRTDSTDQVLNTSIDYTIDIVNSSCIVIGSDLVRIGADGENGSFSITNGCSVEASFQIQSDLALSNSNFTLSPGASQDVSITRHEGDIPGAYNTLVRGRLGSGRQELLGNVKTILDVPADSCFTLSRFEFDIFDSPYSEFDGVDRGYLRNNCTQKPVSVSVYGDEGFNWNKVLQDMLVGAVAGYFTSGEFTPWDDRIKDWLKKGDDETVSQYNARAANQLNERFSMDTANAIQKLKELSEQQERQANVQLVRLRDEKTIMEDEYQKIFDEKNNEVIYFTVNRTMTTRRPTLIKNQECVDCWKRRHKRLTNQINKLESKLKSVLREYEKIQKILERNLSNSRAQIEELRTEIEMESQRGEIDGKRAQERYEIKRETIVSNFNTIIREQNANKEINERELGNAIREAINEIRIHCVSECRPTQTDSGDEEETDEEELKPLTEEEEKIFADYTKLELEGNMEKISKFEEQHGKENLENLRDKYYKHDSEKIRKIVDNFLELPDAEFTTPPEEKSDDNDSTNGQNNYSLEGQFLLAVPQMHRTSQQQTGLNSFGGIGNTLTQMVPSIGAGIMGGSALGGALISGLVSIMMGQDNVIQYSDTFVVPLIDDIRVTLQSDGGVRMSVGGVTYDYDQYYQNLTQQATGGGAYQPNQVMGQTTAGNLEGQGLTQRPHGQGILFNPQALRATLGLVEVRELEFRNGGQNNPNPYEPFVGIITVTGKEKIYENNYDYKEIERAAKERGEFSERKQNWFLEILNPTPKRIANITQEDLAVAETRDYQNQFRVLFNSYEYVECGPNTYPCAPPEFASCTVGSKSGMTGPEAAPRLLLNWEWENIAIDQCDESNANYTYCDTTQATISTLKKIAYLKNFFNQNTLTQCPTAIDTLGTKSQSLNTNTIDVAITNIRFIENNGNYEAEVVVRTNNAQEMGATIDLQIRRDGTIVGTSQKTKTFTTSATYNIPISDNIGTGRFDVIATMDPQLCVGCQNNDTTNDSITSTLLVGASGVQECQSYDTRRDNFEKVLSANNINDPRVLEYVNFNINLTRDSFSEDFKKDLDAYLYDFAVAPQDYVQDLRDLFLSDKFGVKWANEPGAWRAGKYNARLVIEFNNENWQWNDKNDIKSITLHLEYWGDPVPFNPIYNVSFNGTVGLHTDNGRQGYGASYNQLTEREFVVTEGARTIRATPNPLSNTPTRVNVSVDESFYNMNFTRPGNVLTVQRIGEDVELTLSPSIAVPVILDITRNQALDAYAYYSVDIDGMPQTTGSSLFRWNGIGQGCVAHDGSSMTTYVNSPDTKNSSGDGYGLRWDNTVASGTSSFYSTFYVPEKSSARLRIMSQSETANFVSTHARGQQIVVDSGEGIRSLSDVFDAVRNEEICVIGGEYFWNSETVIEPLRSEITSRENTCMTISN